MRFTPKLPPAAPLDPRRRTGLLLLGMGGPDGPESVGPFLSNLFADPMVLPLPAWLSRPVGKLIVRRRVDAVRERYSTLGHGGGSPQLDWTRRQADRLVDLLRARKIDVVAGVAMRYWHPFTDEALATLREYGARQVLGVPTYPQYSAATTGSSLAELERVMQTSEPRLPLRALREWPLLPGYLAALAGDAAVPLARWHAEGVNPQRCALVYTAHSLPERFVRHGDPYVRQTRATVASVHARVRDKLAAARTWTDGLAAGGSAPMLAFQSKVGPVRWVGPPTELSCVALARRGVTHLVVVPVSFTCDHIETLDELDNELGHAVRDAGVTEFVRVPALNLHDGWLRSLADELVHRCFPSLASAGAAGGTR